MRYFVIFLLVIGISLLYSGMPETEARTVYPLTMILEDKTVKQHSFITDNGGVPVITIQKEQTVSLPFKVNPLVSEPLSVTFSHSIETAMPDSRKATIPNMKIEFEPFNMVLKPDESQMLNVTITTFNYTQLGEHRITVTAQYPQGEPLLNTGFDVLVIYTDKNPCWDTTENHARPCTSFESEEFFDFMGSAWMESKHQEMSGALQSDTLHDWIEQTPNHYHWNVYQYYSNTDDYMEYLSHQSPLKQVQSGIQFNEIQCKDGLVLIQKYDRTPACVTESTKLKLVERGWTLTNYQAVLEDTKKLDYVKEFLAKYPHARERLLEDSKTVYYETWGIRPDYGIDDKIMTKRLIVSLDNPMKPRITCGSGITMESTDVKRFLNQKDWCFSEKYSAETLTFGKARDIADSNMSHSEKIKALERYATEDLDGLLFTASFATGLKEQYEYGEDIDFEVTQYGYEIPCISPNIKVYLDGYERPIFEDHEVYPCPYFSEPSGIVNTWSTDKVFDLFPHCRYNGVHSLVTHTKSSGSIEIGKYYCNGQETFLPPAIHTIIIPKGAFDESLQESLLPNELNVRWGDYLRFDNRADSKLRVIGDSPRDPSPTTVEFSYTLEPNDSETVRIVYDGMHWIRVETVDKQIIPWLNGTINVR